VVTAVLTEMPERSSIIFLDVVLPKALVACSFVDEGLVSRAALACADEHQEREPKNATRAPAHRVTRCLKGVLVNDAVAVSSQLLPISWSAHVGLLERQSLVQGSAMTVG
jgi:hypothetical protein